MNLSDYQKKRGLTDAQAARFFGVNPITYGRHKKGERDPRRDYITNYYVKSDGLVTANDFYPECLDPKSEEAVGPPMAGLSSDQAEGGR